MRVDPEFLEEEYSEDNDRASGETCRSTAERRGTGRA